jgi:hypothetical protein
MHIVGHSESDLDDARLRHALITGNTYQPAAKPGDQRCVIGPGLTANAFRFTLGIERAQAEKPQVQVVRRHRRVHRAHVLSIAGMGRPYLHGAPVRQERVGSGAHLAP